MSMELIMLKQIQTFDFVEICGMPTSLSGSSTRSDAVMGIAVTPFKACRFAPMEFIIAADSEILKNWSYNKVQFLV